MIAHIVTAAERQRAAGQWLACAAPVPALAFDGWRNEGLALLPSGVLFAVVPVPAAEVHAAARTDQPRQVDRYLSRVLGGPVFCYDSHDAYYAMVPATTARGWNLSDVPCLGPGRTVAVPRPGLTRDDGARAFWSVQMDSPALLCEPALVAHLILAGRRRGATCG
ncbi:hypothetical protein [Streptomyces sp. NRRL S-350]|uniref:hypothetical protein n=1 Tax=Streptomyces sp. NRRL S-350 TaxID=1463902 RepID=UPI00068CEE4D|nr:hypothetical protein [Streptomyces sp. NRRL S-350]